MNNRKLYKHALAALILLVVIAAVPGKAQAQGGAMSIQTFRPAMDSKGHLTVDTTQILSPGVFSFGLTANFGLNPLHLEGNNRTFKVKSLTSAHLQFAIGIMRLGRLPFLEIGVGAPIHILTGNATPLPDNVWDQDNTATVRAPLNYEANGNFSSQGIGDVYFNTKMQFISPFLNPYGVGAMLSVGFPSSKVGKGDDHLMGSGGVSVWPKVLVDRFMDKKKKMLLSGNLGFRMQFGTTGMIRENKGWAPCMSDNDPPCPFEGEGDNVLTKRALKLYEMTYGVGFNWNLVENRIDWVSELYGSIEFASLAKGKEYTKRVFPMELMSGLKVYLATNSYLAVGAGVGLTGVGPLNNVGAPDFRVFTSFVFEPLVGDRDGDGIPDNVDLCPDEPEDFDGFEDEDGCPDPDNDGDGICDNKEEIQKNIEKWERMGTCKGIDLCPNEPGPPSNQGCPVREVLDRDGDGIPDGLDKCPDEPEDFDKFEDSDGCPEPDNDQDGIPDIEDQCPGTDKDKLNDFAFTKEDHDGYMDHDGCPDPDNDGDKICDNNEQIQKHLFLWEKKGNCKSKDLCPDEPETYNNYKDDDGCPDRTPVRLTSKGITILDKIYFVTDKAIIKPVSFAVLDAIAKTLIEQKEIKQLEVQGHTDQRGSQKYNVELSTRRANAVRKYLIDKGVEPNRLTAKGYGKSRLKCKQHTPACWSQNRRVEFIILQRE